MKEILIKTKFLEWDDIPKRDQVLIFKNRVYYEFIDNPEHLLWEKEMASTYGVDDCRVRWDMISIDYNDPVCPTILSHRLCSTLSKTLSNGKTAKVSADGAFTVFADGISTRSSSVDKDMQGHLHNLQQIAKEIDAVHLPKHVSQTIPSSESIMPLLKSYLYQDNDGDYIAYDQTGNYLWQVQI